MKICIKCKYFCLHCREKKCLTSDALVAIIGGCAEPEAVAKYFLEVATVCPSYSPTENIRYTEGEPVLEHIKKALEFADQNRMKFIDAPKTTEGGFNA